MAATATGMPKRDLYQRALELKAEAADDGADEDGDEDEDSARGGIADDDGAA